MAGLLLVCIACLQVVFAARIALMVFVDPQSTSFQRSEAWRLLVDRHALRWSQEWVDASRIASNLKRAVIASEDAGFADHGGVDWEAIEKAWARNQRAEARVESQVRRNPARPANARLVGGSTISQQLAKNLFLSGERTTVRKAQELLLTLMLEALLSKQRLLEIYLNHVEWGEGVFGAQAAARHYFGVDASRLGAEQAARLAVMLPAPKRFEKLPGSAYVAGRAATIVARMGAVTLP
ncbi:MAG: monofunctional biosynthetic peptidoglycan transglycosylase [Rubrivivax sp.]|nr:monofunctional biosynthetic peptidoglycan transglycosylase [Rubrivivax sp.]